MHSLYLVMWWQWERDFLESISISFGLRSVPDPLRSIRCLPYLLVSEKGTPILFPIPSGLQSWHIGPLQLLDCSCIPGGTGDLHNYGPADVTATASSSVASFVQNVLPFWCRLLLLIVQGWLNEQRWANLKSHLVCQIPNLPALNLKSWQSSPNPRSRKILSHIFKHPNLESHVEECTTTSVIA